MARFDLNLLGALDALLTQQNVTRAAEVLNVTQPTMSGMLQRLRYQFDDPLLVRNGRGMVLTRFASSLVEPVQEALKGVGSLVLAEPNFDPAASERTFTIMASDYCAGVLIPRVFARMGEIAPKISLVLRQPHAAIERTLAGDIDICITTHVHGILADTEDEGKLQCENLFSDDLLCVVSRSHSLKRGGTREAYFRYPHVSVDLAGISSANLAAHRKYLPEYKPTFTVDDFSLVPCVVANASAVGILPKRLARIAEQAFGVRSFAPPISLPGMTEVMRWHSRFVEEPAHGWLRRVLLEEARTLAEVDTWNSLPVAAPNSLDLSRRSRSRSTTAKIAA